MLKCVHVDSREFIIILDPKWKAQLNDLKKIGDQDRLACPVCQQPVRVRAGSVRIWHFAHKHLQNCPLQYESPQLLQTRAALYEWLLLHYPAERVSVEKFIPDLPFPRHVDCWLDLDAVSVLYWIFDSRRPPRERLLLEEAFNNPGFRSHILFTSAMLQPDNLNPHHIFLSTTERAFMTASQFDESIRGYAFSPGKTLHYLNLPNNTLFTYRNLHLVHPPQVFSGYLLTTPFLNVTPYPNNGEFVHPGEQQKLEKIQRETLLLHEKQQHTIPRLLKKSSRLEDEVSYPKSQSPFPETPPGQQQDYNPFDRTASCRVCGMKTRDWITYDGKTGTCLCRHCYNKQKPK